MSKGKYSPTVWYRKDEDFSYNCYGNKPEPWTKELAASGLEYDQKTMFGDYDSEGFDKYGYSCFDAEGNYVGSCCGVDRNGYTELDYLMMTDEEFESIST